MLTKLKRIEGVLLFLILLFLPTQLGKHFWPDYAYIYSLRIDYLSPTLYFWDILVIGLLVVWFLGRPKINKFALNLFLFFLFTQALSLIGTSNPGAGLVRLEQFLITGSFGVFLASLNFKELRQRIYLPMALGILGESIVAILQFAKGSTLGFWILGERAFTISTPAIAKFDFYGIQFLRPYATFPHPNVLAAFVLLGIAILYQTAKDRKAIAFLAFILGSITIFLTMSRVVLLAGLAALVSTMKKRWLIFAGLIFLIVSPILFTRFSSILSFDNLAYLRRQELLWSAYQIFLKYPFFGVGLNNFIPTVANDLLIGPSRFLQPVHNIFLLVLSETGMVGLIGFICLIGFPIRKILKTHAFHIPSLLPWFIIIFLGMFDHYFLTLPQGYRLLFLVWGLSFSMLK